MDPLARTLRDILLLLPVGFGVYLIVTRVAELSRMRQAYRRGLAAVARVVDRGWRWETRRSRLFWVAVQFPLPHGEIVEATRRVTPRLHRFAEPDRELVVRYLPERTDWFVFEDDRRVAGIYRLDVIAGAVMAVAALSAILFLRH